MFLVFFLVFQSFIFQIMRLLLLLNCYIKKFQFEKMKAYFYIVKEKVTKLFPQQKEQTFPIMETFYLMKCHIVKKRKQFSPGVSFFTTKTKIQNMILKYIELHWEKTIFLCGFSIHKPPKGRHTKNSCRTTKRGGGVTEQTNKKKKGPGGL